MSPGAHTISNYPSDELEKSGTEQESTNKRYVLLEKKTTLCA
jgi:hypothetical protein